MQSSLLTDLPVFVRLILYVVIALITLKVAYTLKGFSRMPKTKPGFAWLPKYTVSIPVETADIETDLSSHFARYGFVEVKRDPKAIVYSRGSALGDFSVKIAKIVATVPVPVSNPVQLQVQYGVIFGCAFDTGDLWKFCMELSEKVEADVRSATSNPTETGNPYQPPTA